jgi:exopolysaccharide production protein ExoZ
LTSVAAKVAPTKINNLQALRAFAAVCVVIFHTGFAFPHVRGLGSFGVDIFFVLSGYIMARICEKNPGYFLRRRLIRILPPYWLLTILLFIAAYFVPALMGSTRAEFSDLWKSLFFIPFIKESGIIRPLLFVGWSLNYEMFFYMLIWISLIVLPRRPMLLASILVALAHFASLLFHQHEAFLIFLHEPFILEFPLGAIAYHLAKRVSAPQAERWRVGSLLMLIAATSSLIAWSAIQPMALGQLNGGIFSLFCFFIVLSTSLLSQGGWDTRIRWIVLLGDASYILYLIHPYIEYSIQRILVPRAHFLAIASPLGCFIAVSIACVFGILLHLYGENPLLNYLNKRFGGRRKSAEFRVLIETKGQVNP